MSMYRITVDLDDFTTREEAEEARRKILAISQVIGADLDNMDPDDDPEV
jgi:hypothetical protein